MRYRGLQQFLEEKSGQKFNYKVFSGYLAGKNLNIFIEACRFADIVLLDQWTYSETKEMSRYEREVAFKNMEAIAAQILKINKKVRLFALKLGTKLAPVHEYAQPVTTFTCDPVIDAIKS